MLSHEDWRRVPGPILADHWLTREIILSLGTLGGPAADLVCIRLYASTSEPNNSASLSTVPSPDRANLHVPVGHARRHCLDLKVQEAGSPQQCPQYLSHQRSKTNPPTPLVPILKSISFSNGRRWNLRALWRPLPTNPSILLRRCWPRHLFILPSCKSNHGRFTHT